MKLFLDPVAGYAVGSTCLGIGGLLLLTARLRVTTRQGRTRPRGRTGGTR